MSDWTVRTKGGESTTCHWFRSDQIILKLPSCVSHCGMQRYKDDTLPVREHLIIMLHSVPTQLLTALPADALIELGRLDGTPGTPAAPWRSPCY